MTPAHARCHTHSFTLSLVHALSLFSSQSLPVHFFFSLSSLSPDARAQRFHLSLNPIRSNGRRVRHPRVTPVRASRHREEHVHERRRARRGRARGAETRARRVIGSTTANDDSWDDDGRARSSDDRGRRRARGKSTEVWCSSRARWTTTVTATRGRGTTRRWRTAEKGGRRRRGRVNRSVGGRFGRSSY